jgi:hypothetical protein
MNFGPRTFLLDFLGASPVEGLQRMTGLRVDDQGDTR